VKTVSIVKAVYSQPRTTASSERQLNTVIHQTLHALQLRNQKPECEIEQSSEYTSNIIQSETHAMSLATVDVLPKKTSLQRMVQRKRACPEGHGLIDELRVTQRGEAFFLEEDGQNGFYMFASQKNLDK